MGQTKEISRVNPTPVTLTKKRPPCSWQLCLGAFPSSLLWLATAWCRVFPVLTCPCHPATDKDALRGATLFSRFTCQPGLSGNWGTGHGGGVEPLLLILIFFFCKLVWFLPGIPGAYRAHRVPNRATRCSTAPEPWGSLCGPNGSEQR